MSSNNLDLSSVWKSLVASCECVCVLSLNARFQRVRLQPQSVRLQREMRSSSN